MRAQVYTACAVLAVAGAATGGAQAQETAELADLFPEAELPDLYEELNGLLLREYEIPDHAAPEERVDLGGALRYNLFYKDYEDGGDAHSMDFDLFRINLDGTLNDVLFSAEYRFYSGFQALHHGWIGYDFTTRDQVQLGVHQVPFGILPFASHNYFFQLPYYLGLEDDYDAGIKWIRSQGNWNLQLAYYINDEGHMTGDSRDSARYSFDMVRVGENELPQHGDVPSESRERNQVNARVGYAWDHPGIGFTELGVSGQWGQIYNGELDRDGDRWAGAAHIDGYYGRWNVKLAAIAYKFEPEVGAGQRDDLVAMGAFDAPLTVASEGQIYLAGLSYTRPVDWGPISAVTFYDNFSILVKDESDFDDSKQNVVGMSFLAEPVFTYMEVAAGKNQPFLGDNYVDALGEGGDGSWNTRFNVNVGLYF